MKANQITATAAVVLVAMVAYALYYNSDFAKESRENRRANRELMRQIERSTAARMSEDSLDWLSRIHHEGETAVGIRFIDSATAKRCTRVTDVEADADLTDLKMKAADSVYDHRIRSYARGHLANTVLVTQKIVAQGITTGWRGDAYKCP